MAKKNQHVIPLGNGWAVKGDGNKRFTLIAERQSDAIRVAREIAKNNNADLLIHGKDGKIMEMDSYSNYSSSPQISSS